MEILWKCTTDDSRWESKGALKSEKFDIDKAQAAEKTIDVNQNIRYQCLDKTPWGGCFADRGYMAMARIGEEEKDEILKALFGDDGLGFTTARLPVGNSDYSVTHKSYNENTDDFNMEHFSIESDEKYLIPYIKKALKIRPDIEFFGSPWSPPSWIKNNNNIHGPEEGNTIKFSAEYLNAYALYFVKYLKAYAEQGIKVSAIAPQNEPTMDTAYASCVWTGAQLNEFIRDYLYPAMQKNNVDVKLWLGTFTDSQKSLCMPTLKDETTLDIIDAVCFQWWGAPLANEVHRKYKGLKLIQSETKCGNGKNDWLYAEEQFDCFKEFLDAGVNRYYLWNMVLDENGENTAENPWRQNAPITVHSETNEISYNPSFYLTKHFSKYIKGGAARIDTKGTYEDMIAFQNPDGENVLEVKNGTDNDITVAINFNGEMILPTIPAHSINTFRAAGVVTSEEDATYACGTDTDNLELRARLTNVGSGMLLSVSASADESEKVVLLDNRGEKHQIWEMEKMSENSYIFMNYSSKKALTSSDTGIIQKMPEYTDEQVWELVPVEKDKEVYYRLVNKKSGNCLAYNNASVVENEYTGDETQIWDFVFISGNFEK